MFNLLFYTVFEIKFVHALDQFGILGYARYHDLIFVFKSRQHMMPFLYLFTSWLAFFRSNVRQISSTQVNILDLLVQVNLRELV